MVRGNDITGNSTLEDKCSENNRTEGSNIEFRASEGCLTLEIKSERDHSPNLFLNDSGQLKELVDLEMKVVEEEEGVSRDDMKLLECKMCDEVFPSQEDLEEHLMTHAGSNLHLYMNVPCVKGDFPVPSI